MVLQNLNPKQLILLTKFLFFRLEGKGAKTKIILVPLDEVFFVLEADMEPKLNENTPVNSCVIETTPTLVSPDQHSSLERAWIHN